MLDTAATALLTLLDPLDYPSRMRSLTAETRRLVAEGGLDEVLDELAGGAEYQRRLALFMASVAGRTDRVIGALADPLYRIRCEALSLCVRRPEADEAILATLADAPMAWRVRLIGVVKAGNRPELADRVLNVLREQGDERNAARILSACSAPVAAGTLPELAHQMGAISGFAARNPDAMLDFAHRRLADLGDGARAAWWDHWAPGVLAAAEARPARVLDLLERFPVPTWFGFGSVRIHPLVRHDEARVLRILANEPERLEYRWNCLSRGLHKRLTGTGLPEIEAVGRAVRENPRLFSRLLHDLPPSRRAAFYDKVTADKDTSRLIVSPLVLDVLPRERRHAEARRMLDLGEVRKDPDLELAIRARLPWAQAVDHLRTAVRGADPRARAAAYPLLIGCAAGGGDPAEVTALLTGELGRLRNEQDPVRSAALAALATVPADLFEDESRVADALTGLAVDAIEARDASHLTRAALGDLAARIVAGPAGPTAGAAIEGGAGPEPEPEPDRATGGVLMAWALTVIQELARATGGVTLVRLERSLRRGQEVAVYRAMEPWITRGLERGDHRPAVALARSLGRRQQSIAGLQSALDYAIRHSADGAAREAITLWLADPAHRSERAAELVAWDPTTATIHMVANVLSHTRTDLLDRFLTDPAPKAGRFVAKDVDWFPHLTPSTRWLPRQLEAYARLLANVAADTGATTQRRVSAIGALGAVPGPGQNEVHRYLDSPDVPLAEAALGALAWADDPAANLPLLLDHAGGDRARVAVYAANRAARFVRPSRTAAILRPLATSLNAKVTSRKEAVRIAANLAIPDLVGFLAEVWQVDGQHRDVKAAVVSRLSLHLDDARVLPMLREALTADPEIAAPLLNVHSYVLPEQHRADFGDLIADLCLSEDPKTADTALSRAPHWYPWSEKVASAVCEATADPGRPMLTRSVPVELQSLLSWGLPISQFTDIIDTLLAADDAQAAAAADPAVLPSAEHDRPARRRLTWILDGTLAQARYETLRARPALQAAAEALAGRLDYLNQAVKLLAGAVPLDGDAGPVAGELLALADRAAGRYDAADAIGGVLARVFQSPRNWDASTVLTAAEALAARPDQAAGLIAVRLVSGAGPFLGWPEPYRIVVSTLRRHADVVVAAAALDVNTGTS